MQARHWNSVILLISLTFLNVSSAPARADSHVGNWTIREFEGVCTATSQVDASGKPARFNRMSIMLGPGSEGYRVEVAFWPGAVREDRRHALYIGNAKDFNLTVEAIAVSDSTLLTQAPIRFSYLRRFSESDQVFTRTPSVRQELAFNTRSLRFAIDELQNCRRGQSAG